MGLGKLANLNHHYQEALFKMSEQSGFDDKWTLHLNTILQNFLKGKMFENNEVKTAIFRQQIT